VLISCLVVVVTVGTCVLAFIARGAGVRTPRVGDEEAAAVIRVLAKRYGPTKNSEHHEEWILREALQDRRGGVFVDVGASHYREYSNTYFLEKELGWSGIAVDPIESFAADYAAHRPRTRFVPLFVADRSHALVKFFVNPNQTLVSSSHAEFTERWGKGVSTIDVRTISLDDLFVELGVTQVDFLNMDIELSEPKALAGFSIQKSRPGLVCIEAHPEVRQAILDYFARNGYVPIARYLRADELNLWLKPVQNHPATATSGTVRSNSQSTSEVPDLPYKSPP
jgi:FkbM family methyltransferase